MLAAMNPIDDGAGPAPDAESRPDGVAMAHADRSLDRSLGELAHRLPVACTADTPLRVALETVRRERVGAIIVVDGEERPIGIVTLGDVLVRIALPQIPLELPIGQVMSRQVHCLPAHAPAFEGALLMARKNIRHVPLLRDGRLVGVISESRLFALWRQSIGAARASIATARDLDALVEAAHAIHALPARLLDEGLSADVTTLLLSALNDMLVERLLELTGCGAALAEAGGCWLAFGSQGRCEQTLATDQDNAILFDDDGDPEARRRVLLPLAHEVNLALDRCGFALCRGGIMAGNPGLCLSYSEWRARFAAWIDRPDAQALLNATIYFDLRPIGGEHALATRLRGWLADHARTGDRFLSLMVLNAEGNAPPLGVWRDFVVSRAGPHPGTVDLKTNGVQPFVEAARVYALSCGVQTTKTVARIEEAGRRRGIPERETAAWRDAFFLIQRARLKLNSAQAQAGTELHNDLDPDTLNDMDRNLLKDAMRLARRMQERLVRDFSLGGTSVRL
jgi:CBS domain-containing protein